MCVLYCTQWPAATCSCIFEVECQKLKLSLKLIITEGNLESALKSDLNIYFYYINDDMNVNFGLHRVADKEKLKLFLLDRWRLILWLFWFRLSWCGIVTYYHKSYIIPFNLFFSPPIFVINTTPVAPVYVSLCFVCMYILP